MEECHFKDSTCVCSAIWQPSLTSFSRCPVRMSITMLTGGSTRAGLKFDAGATGSWSRESPLPTELSFDGPIWLLKTCPSFIVPMRGHGRPPLGSTKRPCSGGAKNFSNFGSKSGPRRISCQFDQFEILSRSPTVSRSHLRHSERSSDDHW